MRLPNRLVLTYYAYAATKSHGFVIPVAVEYLLASGLTFTQVGTAEAAFMAAWTLGEVPTGYASDRIGRRNALVAAKLLTVAALLTLGFGGTFVVFVVGYVLWSVGVTFRSGAGSAWLYDALDERLDTDDFSRVRGRGTAVQLSVTAVTAVLGAWLATLNWVYPFVANAALVAAGIPVLLALPAVGSGAGTGASSSDGAGEGADERDGDDGRDHPGDAGPDGDAANATPPSAREVLSVVRERFARPPLRGFVVYMALFFALTSVVETFVQPVSTGLGVPVAALGWLYAGFSLVAAAGGYVAGDVRDRVGERTWFLAAPLGLALLLVATPLVPLLAFPLFFLLRAVRNLTAVLRGQYLNDRVGSVGRATALSAASMVFALAAAVARQAGGLVADLTTPLAMFGLFGGLFVAATAVLLRVDPPVDRSPAPASAAD